MCIRLPHTLFHASSMEKKLKSKFSKIFDEPKTPKGGCVKGVKEEQAGIFPANPRTREPTGNLKEYALNF